MKLMLMTLAGIYLLIGFAFAAIWWVIKREQLGKQWREKPTIMVMATALTTIACMVAWPHWLKKSMNRPR